MRVGFYAALLGLLVLGGTGCQRTEKPGTGEGRQVAVSWELVSNFTDVKDGFAARFTLTNQGDETLTDRNWALFFNMAPRPILPAKPPQPATVQHINGDWYKLFPAKGFRLQPGASTQIRYAGTEAVTKVTDAPLGLYVVYYGPDGREASIAPVANYTIQPFTRKEQLLRGPGDQYPLPTPENTYRANQSVSLLPPDKLLKIIPSPVQLTTQPGRLAFNASLPIWADQGLENEAKFLSRKLNALTGSDFSVTTGAPAAGTPAAKGIFLKTEAVSVNGTTSEAYRLGIDGNGVSITGSDATGVFYGVQSLLALLPTGAYLKTHRRPGASLRAD